MVITRAYRDQRQAGASSPLPLKRTRPPARNDRLPPARVEQPHHEPNGHDNHRPGQQNPPDLADVAKSKFDDLSCAAYGFGEQRRRIEAERHKNDPDDERNTISRTATIAGDPPRNLPTVLVMTEDSDQPPAGGYDRRLSARMLGRIEPSSIRPSETAPPTAISPARNPQFPRRFPCR
jgi:hypothetical protein